MNIPTIPSFFSRIYETEYAFKKVIEEIQNYGAHHNNGFRIQEEYRRIVSETLDILELIFLYGDSVSSDIIRQEQIEKLRESGCDAHIILANIIERDKSMDTRMAAMDLSIFAFGDRCIGGTSPYTLIYPSPNLRSLDIYCRGMVGNRLFHDIVPLQERGMELKELLSSMAIQYPLPNVIREYIRLSCPVGIGALADLHDRYDYVTTWDGQQVLTGNIPLFKLRSREIAQESDYIIRPTVNRDFSNAKLPLVLSACGLEGAIYFGSTGWSNHFLKDINPTIQIEERILPGTCVHYPYLTESDFLEEKIIEIPHSHNQYDRYVILNNGRSFCLPLKTVFFEYFGKEDILNMISVSCTPEDNSIIVMLRIPVRAGVIEFCKRYDESNIESYDLQKNIAVLPFYKMQGEYNVLSSFGNDVNLEFIDSYTGKHVERYRSCISNDEYAPLMSFKPQGTWDIIEVRTGDCKGLLIPRFGECYDNNPEPYIFNVNIGDAFTTIKCQQYEHCNPEDFCIDIDDLAIGMLTDSPEHCAMSYFLQLPLFKDDKRFPAQIPTRLAVSRRLPEMDNLSLFENAVINFDIEKVPEGFTIETDLLSSLSDTNPHRRNLLPLYCEALVFLMKAKAVSKYRSTNIQFNIVMSSWLSAYERNAYQEIWNDTIDRAGLYRDNIHFIDCDKVIA